MNCELERYLELYEERVAIIQFDGKDFDGQEKANVVFESNALAENRAFYQIVNDFCERNKLRRDSFQRKEFAEGLKSLIKKQEV